MHRTRALGLGAETLSMINLTYPCVDADITYTAAAAVGNRVYLIPNASDSMGVLDTETRTFWSLPIPNKMPGCVMPGGCSWLFSPITPVAKAKPHHWGAAAVGTKLYLTPYNDDTVGVLDTETGIFEGTAVDFLPGILEPVTIFGIQTGLRRGAKYRGAVAVRDAVYFPPYGEVDVGVLNTTTSRFSTIGTGLQRGVEATTLWGAMFGSAARNLTDATFNAAANVTNVFGPGGSGGAGFWGAAAIGSVVVFAPNFAASVGVLNTETSSFSTIECFATRSDSGFAAPNGNYAGAAAVGGQVYLAPVGQDNIGVVDVAASSFSTISTVAAGVTGDLKYVGAEAVGTKVYFVPFRAALGVLDTETSRFQTLAAIAARDGCSALHCPQPSAYFAAAAVGPDLYLAPWKQHAVGALCTSSGHDSMSPISDRMGSFDPVAIIGSNASQYPPSPPTRSLGQNASEFWEGVLMQAIFGLRREFDPVCQPPMAPPQAPPPLPPPPPPPWTNQLIHAIMAATRGQNASELFWDYPPLPPPLLQPSPPPPTMPAHMPMLPGATLVEVTPMLVGVAVIVCAAMIVLYLYRKLRNLSRHAHALENSRDRARMDLQLLSHQIGGQPDDTPSCTLSIPPAPPSTAAESNIGIAAATEHPQVSDAPECFSTSIGLALDCEAVLLEMQVPSTTHCARPDEPMPISMHSTAQVAERRMVSLPHLVGDLFGREAADALYDDSQTFAEAQSQVSSPTQEEQSPMQEGQSTTALPCAPREWQLASRTQSDDAESHHAKTASVTASDTLHDSADDETPDSDAHQSFSRSSPSRESYSTSSPSRGDYPSSEEEEEVTSCQGEASAVPMTADLERPAPAPKRSRNRSDGAHRTACHVKRVKNVSLKLTKDSERLTMLTWLQLERLNASGVLTTKVPHFQPKKAGGSQKRTRRAKEDVIADLIKAWPEGREAIDLEPGDR